MSIWYKSQIDIPYLLRVCGNFLIFAMNCVTDGGGVPSPFVLKMRRVYYLLLSILPLSALSADLEIATAEAFRTFAVSVNSGAADYSGKTIVLTADIDLGGDFDDTRTYWTPIGTTDRPFQGTFDGQGHWVDNLIVDASGEATGDVAGLFGCIGAGGLVQRVGVRSGNIHISAKSSADGNCYLGGIAGLNSGAIRQCANYATVVGNWTMAHLGGIAGANGNIGGGATSGTISDCYNRGTIFTNVATGNCVGGIVGDNDGAVQCVYACSAITSSANYVGDICGVDNGTVANAYSTGDLLGSALDGRLNTVGDYSRWTFAAGVLPLLTGFAVPFTTLPLEDNADNTTTLTDHFSQTRDVKLNGRTLYRDASWNTLTLPFDLPTLQGTPPATATVMRLYGATFSAGTLTLNFTPATAIAAGQPYLVRWEEAGSDIASPTFTAVALASSAAPSAVEFPTVTFRGTYSPVVLSSGDGHKLFLGADNYLYYPASDVTVGAFRAYFELASDQSGVRNFVLNFEEEETDGMEPLPDVECRMGSDDWYDLGGRRIQGRPARRGVYVNKGRRIVIK